MSAPRRVALVVRAARGGMMRHVLDLAEYLPAAGWQPVAVIAPPDPLIERELRELGVPFLAVPMADRVDAVADARSVRAIRARIESLAPDLVHVHSNKAAALTTRALRGLPSPPPAVFTAHNVPSFETAPFLARAVGRAALRSVGRRVSRTIAVSGYLRDRLVAAGLDATRIDVVRNGVDVGAIARRVACASGPGRAPDAPPATIGTMGRLIRDKGVGTLLRAIKALSDEGRDVQCVVIGDGPDEARLRALADELGIGERVDFVGYAEDPYPLVAGFDICALPTRLEAFGLSALECMAAGVPVVASNVGGLAEIITHGVDGFLVPPGDPGVLAAALARLLADPALRTRLAVEAARTAARFSVEAMVAGTVAVYEAALGA